MAVTKAASSATTPRCTSGNVPRIPVTRSPRSMGGRLSARPSSSAKPIRLAAFASRIVRGASGMWARTSCSGRLKSRSPDSAARLMPSMTKVMASMMRAKLKGSCEPVAPSPATAPMEL